MLNAVYEDSPSLAALTSDYLSSEGEPQLSVSIDSKGHEVVIFLHSV